MPAETKDGSGFRVLATAAVSILVGFAIYGALIWAPTERTMGFLQRIFYFHVSSEIAAMLAFSIAFIGNLTYLGTRKNQWDWLSLAAVEVGIIFTTMGTVGGSIWAKPAWGIWWTWDERLTSAFVMWLLYVGYLLLRRLVESPERRALISAVYGAFAYLDVPLVYFSIWWWRTQHPGPMIVTGKLAPDMLKVFLLSFVALSSVMALLIRQRYMLEALRHSAEELQIEIEYRNLGGAA